MEENNPIILKIQKESDVFQKAKLIYNLIKDKGLPLKKIAESLKLSSPYICHLLRLNRLPEMIIDGYLSKMISLSHLFVISRIKNPDKILKVYEKILTQNLTVWQTEELVRDTLYNIKTKGSYLTSQEKKQLCERIARNNNVAVKIIQTRIKSKLIVETKGSLEETTKTLKRIIEGLG